MFFRYIDEKTYSVLIGAIPSHKLTTGEQAMTQNILHGWVYVYADGIPGLREDGHDRNNIYFRDREEKRYFVPNSGGVYQVKPL